MKTFVILTLLFDVFAALTIPADFFLFNVPQVIAICLAVAAIICNLWLLFRVRTNFKRWVKVIVTIITVLFAGSAIFMAALFPYWNSVVFKTNVNRITRDYDYELTRSQALEDLDYAFHYVNKLHPAMQNKKGNEYKTVKNAYDEQTRIIKSSDKITVNELNRCIERMFSVLHDAHTYAKANYAQPLYYREVKRINDSEYYFYGVNGTPYRELLEQKSDLFSYEKEEWVLSTIADYTIRTDLLEYLGIDISNGITYNLKGPDGTIKNQTAYRDEFVTVEEYKKYNKMDQTSNTPAKPFCYYTIDDEHNVAVLTLTSCENNGTYKDCLENMFREVKAHNIQNVAVDVRNNGGGSSLVINSFFRYLDIDDFYESSWNTRLGPFTVKHKKPYRKNFRVSDDLLFKGNVYVLTSTKSFSSAMMFPQYVKDNGIGKVIGETPANDPNGYGDVVRFYMPNSRIFMQISSKKFVRIDEETSEKYVEPDYPCDSDDVLEELYKHTK